LQHGIPALTPIFSTVNQGSDPKNRKKAKKYFKFKKKSKDFSFFAFPIVLIIETFNSKGDKKWQGKREYVNRILPITPFPSASTVML